MAYRRGHRTTASQVIATLAPTGGKGVNTKMNAAAPTLQEPQLAGAPYITPQYERETNERHAAPSTRVAPTSMASSAALCLQRGNVQQDARRRAPQRRLRCQRARVAAPSSASSAAKQQRRHGTREKRNHGISINLSSRGIKTPRSLIGNIASTQMRYARYTPRALGQYSGCNPVAVIIRRASGVLSLCQAASRRRQRAMRAREARQQPPRLGMLHEQSAAR